MRVLVIAPDDAGGALYRWTRALRASDTAHARLVTLQDAPPPPFGPRADLSRIHDGGQELQTLVDTVDVVHLVDLLPSEIPFADRLPGRARPPRCVLHWTGTAVDRGRHLSRLAERTGCPLIAHRPRWPHATFLPPWVSQGVPPWFPVPPGTRARNRSATVVVFASSVRPLAAYPRLEALIDRAEAWATRSPTGRTYRVEVVVDPSPRAVAQRRRRAHVTLADAEGEMPREALESLVQGLPAIAELAPHVRQAYEALCDAPVPVFAPEVLPDLLRELEATADPLPLWSSWGCRATSPERWMQTCAKLYAGAPEITAAL